MKKIFLLLMAVILTGVLILISCKKEFSCEGCRDNNKPPIAVAGPDQVITLPTDSASLDGSASRDPDGKISEWLWTRISGPASFTIDSATIANTIVKNLKVGIYLFELKVTDDVGLNEVDTVMISVFHPLQPNRPPVAYAGPDQSVNLPANTATLDGAGSTDPDFNISSYKWSKISGPVSFSMANTNLAKTQVNDLAEGIYQFELNVTDAGGLFSRDTLSIRVNHHPENGCDISDWPVVQLRLTEIGRLSEPRIPEIGVAGAKIVFAGGAKDLVCSWDWELSSSAVDIYDINSKVWTTARLSKERSNIAVVSHGNKIFFAGGRSWENVGGGATQNVSYSNIDIYDVATNAWSVAHLSKARESISAVTIGSKIIFAGGFFYTGNTYPGYFSDVTNTVDIYDVSTGGWSRAHLSIPRSNSVNLVKGDSVYFIGGWGTSSMAARAVDIYISSTNTWSAFIWSEAEINKFLTDAGLLNGPVAIPCGCGTSVNGNSVVTQIGFYNTATGKCSIGILPQFPSGMFDASYIVVNNKNYYAGGHSQDSRGCYVLSDRVYVME